MIAYWAGLAANGTVGTGWDGVAPLVWPPYTLPGRQSIAFDTPVNQIVSAYNGVNCDFWDTDVGYHVD